MTYTSESEARASGPQAQALTTLVGKGKISDEVHTDVHPRHHAWLQWDGSTGWLRVASLEASTPITVRDICFDIRGQSRPIILAFNELLGFLITRMASDRRVVVGRDDLHA